MADHDFLPVDYVILAVPYRFGLAIGDIAPAVRLGKNLPDADFSLGDRRQELGFLLVAAPGHDRVFADGGVAGEEGADGGPLAADAGECLRVRDRIRSATRTAAEPNA